MATRPDIDRPSTWLLFKQENCDGCFAGCCTLPVEASGADLVRLGVCTEDELQAPRKLANRLMRAGVIQQWRAKSGLFTLAQVRGRDCLYLDKNRRCTVYEKRPDVCRRFPTTVGPRIGFCPTQRFQRT